MLEDAEETVVFARETTSLEMFIQDPKTRKAVIMSLLNIGELTNHLPDEYMNAHPKILWRRMIGMRNLAAHGYRTMDFGIVWEAVQTYIPELVNFLQNQLKEN
jgi:uncharacterized protein with HEPN domain